MYCKNCNSLLNENDKYCNVCGSQVESVNELNNNNVNNLNDNNFDERFIKSYIGNKADKMYDSVKNNGFNIWSVLFGVGYFAYRKMYLISIIIVIISNIIVSLFPSISACVGSIIGLMFCPLYKWDITRKLRKIKNENPNADETSLLSMANKKGGTSIIGAITFFLIYFLCYFLVILVV